jgi:hypothetical protein
VADESRALVMERGLVMRDDDVASQIEAFGGYVRCRGWLYMSRAAPESPLPSRRLFLDVVGVVALVVLAILAALLAEIVGGLGVGEAGLGGNRQRAPQKCGLSGHLAAQPPGIAAQQAHCVPRHACRTACLSPLLQRECHPRL